MGGVRNDEKRNKGLKNSSTRNLVKKLGKGQN